MILDVYLEHVLAYRAGRLFWEETCVHSIQVLNGIQSWLFFSRKLKDHITVIFLYFNNTNNHNNHEKPLSSIQVPLQEKGRNETFLPEVCMPGWGPSGTALSCWVNFAWPMEQCPGLQGLFGKKNSQTSWPQKWQQTCDFIKLFRW